LRLAAVDIGSNAIRFQISKILSHNGIITFKKVEYVRFPLRLGQDVFRNNTISPEKEEKFILLMQTFKNFFDLYEVDDYIICATSAMRESTNGKEIAARVEKEVGVKIDIIDGDVEAELINRVLYHELDEDSYIHIDVGGGSTELNIFVNRKKIAAQSFKIGSVRRLNGQDSPEEWDRMHHWIDQQMERTPKPITAMGTGGNIGKIYELANIEKPKKTRQSIPYHKIEEVKNMISEYTLEDRINVLMLNPDRADVILPASDIYMGVMHRAKAKKMIVPEVGLKDGLILMLYERQSKTNTNNEIVQNVNKYQK